MTVTTIIPTIGRNTLYSRAIPSVQVQSGDWECIVVGDGFLPVVPDDPRISAAAAPKGPNDWRVGGVTAWNTGLGLARGEWVSYLADDDAYHDMHHARLLTASDGVDMVIGRSRVMDPDTGLPTSRVFGRVDDIGPHDIVQGSYIARRSCDLRGDLDLGDEAWDARMLRRLLPTVTVARIRDEVHRYYPAPENRALHRLP